MLDLSRVIVVGTSGCGKTVLARRLSERLGVPHVELDALYWGTEWTPRPEAEFRRRIDEAAAGERWVLDGNYSIARERIWPRATAMVWMNYGFGTVLGRVIGRTLRRILRRERLYSGNRETLGRTLASRDSIVWWSVSTYARRRREYEGVRASHAFPQLEWLELRRPNDSERWLESLSRPTP